MLFEHLDIVRGEDDYSLVVIIVLCQGRVGDVISPEVIPAGVPSEGFRDVKLAPHTPSEILLSRGGL